MISIIQLEYIVAVDTYRHFVKASQKCFVTQPTLSMQIKKLEEHLDVIIFDRTKHPIIPTEIGRKIIEQARIVISESNTIHELIAASNNTVSGELTIGIIPSIAPYLLPLFIGKFNRKYPDVKVKIHELLTEDIILQLKKETIDVGILITPLKEKGIIEEALFYEEMLLFINKNHPFAAKDNIKPDELASPDLWLLDNGNCFRSQVINLCSYRPEISNHSYFEYASGSIETLKKMVEKEGGFTLIPELASTEDNSTAIIKKFKSITPLREVSFAYTRNYVKKQLLKKLAAEIQLAIPKKLLDKSRGTIAEWRKLDTTKN